MLFTHKIKFYKNFDESILSGFDSDPKLWH